MILTIESLTLDLCTAILEQEDQEELEGKAAFLQAVIQKDFGSMDGYKPVYHEDEFIGVEKI